MIALIRDSDVHKNQNIEVSFKTVLRVKNVLFIKFNYPNGRANRIF